MQQEHKYKIFLSPPFQSGNELEFLRKALATNWLAPGGEFVREFESRIKTLINRKHCLALNSGTAAIHLALKVLGVERDDFVICQTFSFVATANPIAYLGATPVFVDSEKNSWNMDPDLLEYAIQDLLKKGTKPKAIIYTHIYGNLARVSELLAISKKHEIPIVEDAAEALGSKINGKYAGGFGDISILSFNVNKVITTSGGGALLTEDEHWAGRAKNLAAQARDQQFSYAHTEVGYNYQMSNITAAIGLAQLPHLDQWTNRKRQIFDEYRNFFNGLGGFEFVHENTHVFFNRWLSAFIAPSVDDVGRIIHALEANGIESRRFWKPLHLLDIYPTQNAYISDAAIGLFERGFCLPSGVGLKPDEQQEINHIIKMLY